MGHGHNQLVVHGFYYSILSKPLSIFLSTSRKKTDECKNIITSIDAFPCLEIKKCQGIPYCYTTTGPIFFFFAPPEPNTLEDS